VWSWYPEHPHEHDIFIWGMNGFTAVHCREIVQAFDFSRFRKLVDVGGGGGVLIGEILRATPNLKGVLFDQPRTIEEARPRIAAAELAHRCEAVGGNFLESLPSGADAYVFKHVLRDWDDAGVLKMLQNCHRAMEEGGTLLIIDAIVDPGNSKDKLLKLIDVQMMVDAGGGLRTLAEFQEFFRKAGFELVKIHRTTILDLNIIEARRIAAPAERGPMHGDNGSRDTADESAAEVVSA